MEEFGQKVYRVLIVDDTVDIHRDIRKVLSWNAPTESDLQRLESTLFENSETQAPAVTLPTLRVDSAFQGQQALEMVEKAASEKQPYHLIFMDVRMPPGMDGIETTKKIWRIQPDAHIIICTAYSDYSIDGILSRLGASDKVLFLTKPFSSAVLKQCAITLLKKWEGDHQLQEHFQNLQAMVEKKSSMLVQSSKMAALGQMSGGVAHEINTPLCVIRLTVQEMEARPDRELVATAVRQTLAKIERMTDRIAKIVSALSTISRTTDGDPFVPVALSTVVEDARVLCSERFHRAGIALEIGEVPDITIDCRRVEISQVFLNVLNNAFDEAVRLPEKWVRMDFNVEKDAVQIRVTDSGRGIPPSVAEKIFDPFFTTKDFGMGTGLGLSVSRGFVESHHGSIVVDASSAHTSFVIRLPKNQAART